jgi:cytochrome c
VTIRLNPAATQVTLQLTAIRLREGVSSHRRREAITMDSWEFTKIAAAVLSALLIIVGGKTAIEVSEASHSTTVVGYKLPVKEVAAAAAASTATGPAISMAKIGPMLASASVESGQGVYKKCAACHTPAKGGANAVGPNMWGIVDRAKASAAGFNYSEAAKAQTGAKWTYESLVGFISNPKGYMPGTKMAFAGIADAQELADLLAYLRTLADTPAPLPN